MREVVIGTRGSQLALWQANWVHSELSRRFPDIKFTLKKITTTGDKILDSPLAAIGDRGLFVKEIELALERGEIDLAVHSMKDVPTQIPPYMKISAISRREDPRDVLISDKWGSFFELPEGARVGTSSLRRIAQLKAARPDLHFENIRGNIDTRLRKLKDEDLDAIILAAAGMLRLGWADRITEFIPFEISLPAVGQGALGVETRAGDQEIIELVQTLHHPATAAAVEAERGFLVHLEGGCQVPIGAHGQVDGDEVILDGLVASLDGSMVIRGQKRGPVDKAFEV
ncbi:MAG: hydroxymethylbilane synthase, partial [Firmicutes bacterium]|nr:hydroxymethylbilane synthase [Bacillota bacterium]